MINAIQPVIDRIQVTKDQFKREPVKEENTISNGQDIISPYCFCQTYYTRNELVKVVPKRKYRPL